MCHISTPGIPSSEHSLALASLKPPRLRIPSQVPTPAPLTYYAAQAQAQAQVLYPEIGKSA